MKKQVIFIIILTFLLSFSLSACKQDTAPLNKSDAETQVMTEAAATDPKPASTDSAQAFTFSENWRYNESDYTFQNADAQNAWNEFKRLLDSGASTDECITALSCVTVADSGYVPGAIEYAKHYMLRYLETGDPSSPSNAMNALTVCYAATEDPILMTLKNEMGWNEYRVIIESALEALQQNNSANAFELLNTLPEEYFNILEVAQVLTALNYFDDTYYYLILGPALGNQYIVHFQLDGTYERVKMNEDGIFDSGTWSFGSCVESSLYLDNGLTFQGAGGSYSHTEYDADYNPIEFTLNINTDGMAKDQFAGIAAVQTEVTGLAALLVANLWQVDEGWYYRFHDDGTGIISMVDDSYSFSFTYKEHPEKENTVMIVPDEAPDEYEWVYDPVSGTFSQISHGYDINTDTMSTFCAEVSVYNG